MPHSAIEIGNVCPLYDKKVDLHFFKFIMPLLFCATISVRIAAPLLVTIATAIEIHGDILSR